ncbi:lipase 3-like [Musca autumnalis]|uniref:lipase 3-like n=1 Tax=Musca autumnalis TaxID=221902 RepID=UPI003CF59944
MGKTFVIFNLLLIPIIIYSIWPNYELETVTTADRIAYAGYSSETHTVWTPDGYGLTIFRIKKNSATKEKDPHATTTSSSAPVVLMMHGLTSSSDVWVIRNHSHNLAIELVDQGYDVWLGNSRGNSYGSRHLNYTTRDREFWRFSWHELGTIDLPTTIDYILNETQQSGLHYIGHSQGTTIAMVMLTTQPEYNAKLKTTHMFAPISFMTSARSLNLRLLSSILGSYSPLNSLIGDREIFEPQFLRHLMGFQRCRTKEANPRFCSFLSATFFGGYSTYVKESLYPELFNTHPSPASTHQALHFVQLHVSGKFRRYDYGSSGNQERYNQSTPPEYDLTKINTRFPFHLYYSDSDDYSSKADVEKLSEILGERCVKHFIDIDGFAHMDFAMAYNVEDVLNRDVVRIINEAERELKSA